MRRVPVRISVALPALALAAGCHSPNGEPSVLPGDPGIPGMWGISLTGTELRARDDHDSWTHGQVNARGGTFDLRVHYERQPAPPPFDGPYSIYVFVWERDWGNAWPEDLAVDPIQVVIPPVPVDQSRTEGSVRATFQMECVYETKYYEVVAYAGVDGAPPLGRQYFSMGHDVCLDVDNYVSDFTASDHSIDSGDVVTLTVTLHEPAVYPGRIISLEKDRTYPIHYIGPDQILVPAGATSISFPVAFACLPGQSHGSTCSETVSARLGSTWESIDFSISHAD